MAPLMKLLPIPQTVLDGCHEVLSIFRDRLWEWFWRPSHKRLLLEHLANANVYEEWEAAAIHLDEVLGYDVWRQNLPTTAYDYRLIQSRMAQLQIALDTREILTLVNLLRSGLVRNLGGITAPKLFNRAYAGTKVLIEMYVAQVALAVETVTHWPGGPAFETGLSSQAKLEVLHDTRQAFGRTCLVMQGGSVFGLCHLGVVKALYLRGLLPRIIAGTATGALMAALVAVHTDAELLDFLSGDAIDLSAFAAAKERAETRDGHGQGSSHGWFLTLIRRLRRFIESGYVLDPKVLEECVRANVGDITFEESYQRTKRVLNITITSGGGGIPTLLNYLTAPNVLIWSAAMASNASDARFSPSSLQCKTPEGQIEPWDISAQSSRRIPKPVYSRAPSTDHDRDSPLSRVGELFNVNHFIVSQARPYIAPFLAPTLHHSNSPRSGRMPVSTYLMRLMIMEVQHRLTQLDTIGWLPSVIKRLLLDESVPGPSWTLVPHVSMSDFLHLLQNPTRQEIDRWILRGERSVWPAAGALRIRCAVEVEIDRGYQLVRRRKPFDLSPSFDAPTPKPLGERHRRKKLRASSLGGD